MKRLGLLIAGFLFVAVTLGQSQPAVAASNTIGVNPRRTYTISPGDTIKDTIVVTNTDKTAELNASIAVLDFQSKDTTGTPAIDLKENKPTTWSLKPYITITSSVKVPAGQSVNVPYSIAIPKTLGGGSYYSALKFSAGGTPDSKNLSLSGAAVSLFFVNVPGKANNNMQLIHFGPFVQSDSNVADGSYNTFYSASPPQYIAYDLKNNGNIAQQPSGSILINDMFGKQYKLFSNANPDNNLVLIQQMRRIKLCWNLVQVSNKDQAGNTIQQPECQNPSLKPGRYTAKLDILYGIKGNSQEEIKQTASFWYLPPWFLITVAVAVLFIVGVIWLIVKYVHSRHGSKYRAR